MACLPASGGKIAQQLRMTLFKGKYRVESIRLQNWDYSANGHYFVTICAKNRKHLFGKVNDGKMTMNEYGIVVYKCWHDLPNHYKHIKLGGFVIMPNHIHGIVTIYNNVEAGLKPASTLSTITASTINKLHGLPEIVRAFKSYSARRINILRQTPGISIWQHNYYEHIIRNDGSLERIQKYIADNPLNWTKDRNNLGC